MSNDDRLDTLAMFDAAAALPEQIEAAVTAAEAVQGLPAGDSVDNVLVLGMGGSGFTGDLLQDALPEDLDKGITSRIADHLQQIPALVHRHR